MQNLQQATLAAQLGLRRDVLPAQQPAHKLCRGDRFDLLTKRGDGEVMYAREQAALAPLDGVAHDLSGEITAKDAACGFQAQQSFVDVCRSES